MLCESLAVTRMVKPPLTSAELRFYPLSSKLQRHGSLHQQAATAQQLLSGWQFSKRVFVTNDHSLFHTESLSPSKTQGCLLDLHTPSYVWGYKIMLQNPKSLIQSHGLQWDGWVFQPKVQVPIYFHVDIHSHGNMTDEGGESVNF